MSKQKAEMPKGVVVESGGVLVLQSTAWLPTDPPRPVPELMTWQEACLYLRIGGTDRSKRLSLYHLRRRGALKGVQVGPCLKYRRAQLEKCLDDLERTTKR